MEDDKVSRLLSGIYRFFNSKFPPINYKTNPTINYDGYHMEYLNVRYSINFDYDKALLNPKGHNLTFRLRADLPEIDKNLEHKLNETKVSNKKLKEIGYLSSQKIEIDHKYINISCKIKKIPL